LIVVWVLWWELWRADWKVVYWDDSKVSERVVWWVDKLVFSKVYLKAGKWAQLWDA
jgi:hypothetical protein